MTYYDLNGREIAPGCEVVFNQSGYVAIGEVIEIKPDTRSPFRIHVTKSADDTQSYGDNHIAQVRHSWSIMVLSSPDEMSFDEFQERYGRTKPPRIRHYREPGCGDGLSGILGTPIGMECD